MEHSQAYAYLGLAVNKAEGCNKKEKPYKKR